MPDGVPASEVGPLLMNATASDLAGWSTTLGGSDCTTPGTMSVSDNLLDMSISGAADVCDKISSSQEFSAGTIVEARIYVPAGPDGDIADWPAFWMTGSDWPTNGEIDIAEGLGGCLSANYHYGTVSDEGSVLSGCLESQPGWYTFDVVWVGDSLTFYYNGTEVYSESGSYIVDAPELVTIDNTEGTYGNPTGSPSTLEVQYVRAWSYQ
jgi:hypothetical protein